jgi:hypothetical protein
MANSKRSAAIICSDLFGGVGLAMYFPRFPAPKLALG